MHCVAYRLLNDYQRDFPLVPQPFAEIAAQCGLTEREVLDAYRGLQREGKIDRIGVLFRPNTVGASMLAALAVPPRELERVARIVSEQPEVNHNYEREHRYNLWFVVTAASAHAVRAALDRIEGSCAPAAAPRENAMPRALRLPLEEEYHIDLGFDLSSGAAPRNGAAAFRHAPLDAAERRLVAAIRKGIPLVSRPYAELGRAAALTESAALAILRRWLESGTARRFGAVVRHLPLGYRANAMVVWDVPDADVAAAGQRAAALAAVTLCYRRSRQLPEWPYNLFCMVHGKVRATVASAIERISAESGLGAYPRQVLFSRRCFAQRPAHYAHAGNG